MIRNSLRILLGLASRKRRSLAICVCLHLFSGELGLAPFVATAADCAKDQTDEQKKCDDDKAEAYTKALDASGTDVAVCTIAWIGEKADGGELLNCAINHGTANSKCATDNSNAKCLTDNQKALDNVDPQNVIDLANCKKNNPIPSAAYDLCTCNAQALKEYRPKIAKADLDKCVPEHNNSKARCEAEKEADSIECTKSADLTFDLCAHKADEKKIASESDADDKARTCTAGVNVKKANCDIDNEPVIPEVTSKKECLKAYNIAANVCAEAMGVTVHAAAIELLHAYATNYRADEEAQRKAGIAGNKSRAYATAGGTYDTAKCSLALTYTFATAKADAEKSLKCDCSTQICQEAVGAIQKATQDIAQNEYDDSCIPAANKARTDATTTAEDTELKAKAISANNRTTKDASAKAVYVGKDKAAQTVFNACIGGLTQCN